MRDVISKAKEIALNEACRKHTNCAHRATPLNVMDLLTREASTPSELVSVENSTVNIINFFEMLCEANTVEYKIRAHIDELESELRRAVS